jgi:hypothetical protein
MGARIPNLIRKRVIQQLLQGVSRAAIAIENDVSDGTISTISNESREDDTNFDLLRELAVMLKREGRTVNSFASSVRLKKQLESRGIDEGQIDSIIEQIHVHCFRRGISPEQLVENIQKVSALSENLGISLDELPQMITAENEKLETLKREVKGIQVEKRKKLRASGITMRSLEEYTQDKLKMQNQIAAPTQLQIQDLQEKLDQINRNTNQVHIDKEALKTINTFLIRPITKDDFLKMIEYLARNPVENIKIFSELQKRALGNFDETMDDLRLGINEN